MPESNDANVSDANLSVIQGKACMHLRSKGMYVTGLLDPTEEDHGDHHCWCNQTAGQYGPDDQFVDRASCKPGRTCYQSIL